MKYTVNFTVALSIFSLLTACSAIVEKTYKPTQLDDDVIVRIAKPVDYQQITIDQIKSNGSQKLDDVISQRYSDYKIIGSSSFRAKSVSDHELKQQAVSVGASRVAVFKEWAGSQQTGVIGNKVPLGGGSALGIATPIFSDVHEHVIVFLVKYTGSKERIGISIKDLPADIQQKFERNKGAFIESVEKGPAFDSNILVGDVVIAINGAQVIDAASLPPLVRDACRKGGALVITVLRGAEGRQRDISIPGCI